MVSADNEAERSVVSADNEAGGVCGFSVENSPDSHKPVEISDLRAQGTSRTGQALEVQPRPTEAVKGR